MPAAFADAATARIGSTRSRYDGVLIEEYVDGPEFSVDSVTANGVTTPVLVAEKHTGLAVLYLPKILQNVGFVESHLLWAKQIYWTFCVSQAIWDHRRDAAALGIDIQQGLKKGIAAQDHLVEQMEYYPSGRLKKQMDGFRNTVVYLCSVYTPSDTADPTYVCPKDDPAVAKVRAAYQSAAGAQDGAALAKLYTPDGVEMPPNESGHSQ